MSDPSAAGLQGVAAMNAHTCAMSPAGREQWYKDHPVSDYEKAIAILGDGEDDGPEVPDGRP